MGKLKQHISTISQANVQSALLILLDKIEKLNEDVLMLQAYMIEDEGVEEDEAVEEEADSEDDTADQESVMTDAFNRMNEGDTDLSDEVG
jgi:hypothetical protein